MKVRTGVTAIVAMAFAAVTAACGSSSSSVAVSNPTTSDSSTSSAAKPLKVTWTYTGPEKDGGYNEINEVAMNAMGTLPGVTVQGIYNVPYSDQATQIVKQAIASGSNVIVDTVGLGKLLTDVCKQNPQVKCFSGADAETQAANAVSWWPRDWDLAYVAGVAAGLTTKSNVVGMVVPYKIPIAVQEINAYTLGCQSVDPSCTTKVVFTNNYFDPSAATQASQTLISAGADVLRNVTDDPSFCKVAETAKVWAVGEYNDFSSQCPGSIITSTVWDFSNYMKAQAVAIQNGTFKGTGSSPTFLPLSTKAGDPRLGTFGSFVSPDVKAKINKAYQDIMGGKNPFVGPITDQQGAVRVPAGKSLSDTFLFSGWNWYVKGVTTSGG
jgi:basic membrane lipoprotein Med (substrate-binding protein (PBP1-ABC) superfamily)